MKPYFLSISIVVILLLPSCNTNRTNKMEQELTDFIKHYEKTFVPLNIEANKAWYDAAVSGKKEDYDKAANLAVKLSKYYTNKTDFAQLKNKLVVRTVRLTLFPLPQPASGCTRAPSPRRRSSPPWPWRYSQRPWHKAAEGSCRHL